MAWDVGDAVAVTGEDFLAAWRVAVGDESRDGEINQRLDGRPLRVRGMMAVTDAGVTGVEFGVEHQPADRSTTGTTTYSLPIGTVDVYGAFEAWITPPADQVWGRPYIAVAGSAGAADFADIHVERSATGLVRAADIVPGDLTNGWPQRATSTLTPAHAPTTGVLIWEVDIVANGGYLEIVSCMDIELSSGSDFDFLIYIDATYAGGGTPSGYRRKSTIKTGTSNTTKAPYTVVEPVGDPQNPGTDPPLAAGAHTIRVYIRNATNAAAKITDRSLKIREFNNDTAT